MAIRCVTLPNENHQVFIVGLEPLPMGVYCRYVANSITRNMVPQYVVPINHEVSPGELHHFLEITTGNTVYINNGDNLFLVLPDAIITEYVNKDG